MAEERDTPPAFHPDEAGSVQALQPTDILRLESAQANGQLGYYGIPMLKRPTWGWHIALYFFLGGISAGSFLMAGLSELFGDRRLREISRAGYVVSFISFLPCPPLLVADLGRPKRFHHMLRVFKPSSPMNIGAWTLAAYSLPLTALALHCLTAGDSSERALPAVIDHFPSKLLAASGTPLALVMASYPGVLLSTTSTPLWSQNRFLGILFACSSITTGAAAISIVLELTGASSEAVRRLKKVEKISGLCEMAALLGYLAASGKKARALAAKPYGWHLWLGVFGTKLMLPALGQTKSPRRKKGFSSVLLTSALALAGGFALKWAITLAGRASAEDLQASREATKPSADAPGWYHRS